MAGKESRGVEQADADLFRGRPYVLTSRDAELETWIERIGARLVVMTAAEHDRLVAVTSHLPQLISTALASVIGAAPDAAKVAGPAAVDLTRLALSPYEIWRDIFATNADSVDAALGRSSRSWIDVVDGERIAIDRLHHGLKLGIVANGLGHQRAQLARVVGIDGLVAEPGLERILKRKSDLFGHHVVGVVRLLHRGVQQLARVDQRNRRRNDKHQRRDGQYELGLETHDLGNSVLAVANVFLDLVVQGLEADAQYFSGASFVLARGFKCAEN